MKTKITLLAISAALLLKACGQMERSLTETTLPPTPMRSCNTVSSQTQV